MAGLKSAVTWLLASTLAVLLSALLIGYAPWQARQQAVGYDKAQAEYVVIALKADHAARSQEWALQSQLTKAQDAAKFRETQLEAVAVSARAAAASLRDDLSSARSKLSEASRASLNQYASTSTELLAECGAAYTDLARQAGGHASDSLMLQEGWPGLTK